MTENYEVIIVGAGTAGTYLAWLLGKQGHSVLIVEKDAIDKVGSRLDIIHFETERIQRAGIPPFRPGEPDCIEIRNHSTIVTPDFKTKIKVQAYQTIVRLSYFLQKMYLELESLGVKIKFKSTFTELVYVEGKIAGIKVKSDDKITEIRARLVVDASGTKAVVRTSLPEHYGIETFKLGPNDVMYVLLQYIKWKNPDKPHPPKDTSYIYYLSWLGPSHSDDSVILGIGQPGSYENARLARDDLLDKLNLPAYEVYKEEKGFTPYRRPPYSLVSDGFLCIGDAAAITYPFSGHGVTATWMLDIIAAEIIDRILKEEGYLSKQKLWAINVNYFKDQGAKFASLLVQLSGILNFTEKEWNYVLKKGLIYKTAEEEIPPEPNKEYEEELSLKDLIKFIGGLLGGLLKRKLSYKNVKRLLSANGLGNKIKKHYEKYPINYREFRDWVEKADTLWCQKKVAIKNLPSVAIEYH